MKNLLILGCGRSGTSMAAGLFRNTGAFMGDNLLPPTVSNKFGYFEDRAINDLNNRLLQQMLGWSRPRRYARKIFGPAAHADVRCLWLAAPRRLRALTPSRSCVEAIRSFCERPLFCYKDPRFDMTLPQWRPYLPSDTRFLVVFRDPHKTVDSILRDAHEVYTPPLPLTRRWAYTSWTRHYRRILEGFSTTGQWLFVHYDQIAKLEAIPSIEAFSETSVDSTHIDPLASRARESKDTTYPCMEHAEEVYQRLRERASRDARHWKEQHSTKGRNIVA